ncbi:hypothetical protein IGI04_003004 [Brassica rapa subsp. trilocularis]|uniref:Uncharacterized protein n=1 Tax=Brassica rapa subsp. trilocularis TaxID=1813537 RepID=A0ABQ7NX52_BRACM|nr:hypothetical protein IGI04_003004 [Brassica rapa subsp. trilocularis]
MYFLLIYLFCRFLIKWYSSFTNLEVFQIWKTSGTTYLLVVRKSSGLLGSLLKKSSGLPGSRLDYQEVVWTSRKSSGLPGSRLDFSERFGFSDLEDFWDDLLVSRLEVVWKSSGSRLDFLKVVWTSCKVVWKSSELSKSLLAKSSELPGSRLDFLKVVWSFLLKWNPSLSL